MISTPNGSKLTATLLMLVALLPAQTSFDWLSASSYPAQIAMASAGIAQNSSPEALSQNPGALGTTSGRPQYWIGGQLYPAGISQLVATLVIPGNQYAVGLSLRGMKYGRFSGYDGSGIPLDAYYANETAIRAGLRRKFGNYLALGGSLGIVTGQLADVASAAAVYSAGFQIHLTAVDAYLGGSIQNGGQFISNYAAETVLDELPTNYMVGLSKDLAHLPLTFHIAAGKALLDGTLLMRVGGEFRLPGALIFRWGLDDAKTDYSRGEANADLFSGLSFGLGTRASEGLFAKVALDSAIKLQGPLGMTTAFALSIRR